MDEVFKGVVPKFCFSTAWDALLNSLMHLKKEYRLDRLMVLAVVNWSSPSIVRGDQMQLQIHALQQLLSNDEFDAMGLVVMPVWERAKGSLYKIEALLLKTLSAKGLTLDEKASLSFEERVRLFFSFPVPLSCLNQF